MGVVSSLNATLRLAAIVAVASTSIPAPAITGEKVQARVSADLAAGAPVVVHVVVALCDNENQGIVPVQAHLGNGQDPKTNLYWGALYGVRTHLTRSAGWHEISTTTPTDERILSRAVFHTTVRRNDAEVPVYLVADAWDGSKIRPAIQAFLDRAAGGAKETIQIRNGSNVVDLHAGGAAHLVAYVGHNGLMDFALGAPKRRRPAETPGSSLVLACASKEYFEDLLAGVGSHALLLTTGLMAPEAYTLDAVVRAWVRHGSSAEIVESAAVAYNRYQKCGIGAARRLFWGSP